MQEIYRILNHELCLKYQQSRELVAKTEKNSTKLLGELQEERIENNHLNIENQRLFLVITEISNENKSLLIDLEQKKTKILNLEKSVEQFHYHFENFSKKFKNIFNKSVNETGFDKREENGVLNDITNKSDGSFGNYEACKLLNFNKFEHFN